MEEAEFNFTDLLPLTSDPYTTTDFRKLSEEGVNVLQMYGIAEVGCIAYETMDQSNNLVDGM